MVARRRRAAVRRSRMPSKADLRATSGERPLVGGDVGQCTSSHLPLYSWPREPSQSFFPCSTAGAAPPSQGTPMESPFMATWQLHTAASYRA